MSLKYPDRIESNNPSEYGIARAVEISGHRNTLNLQSLLSLSDAVLSDSKINTNDDAIGQLWFVTTEQSIYQLVNWSKRRTIDGWKRGGKGIGGGFEGSIPTYSKETDIPVDTTDLPDEYLLAGSGNPAFTEDEEKIMIMKAIDALGKRFGRIERAFTDHMDCGGVNNDKMLHVMNDKSVEAKEPIWASEDGKGLDMPDFDVIEAEPEDTDIIKITHLSIKSGKWDDFQKISNYLLPFEFVWIYDNNRLYIKQNTGKMYWINKEGGGEEPDPDPDPELPDMDNLESIGFISPDGSNFKVTMEDEGKLKIIKQFQEAEPDKSQLITSGTFEGMSKNTHLPKLYINSFFCGGTSSEVKPIYQGCSHNFIELSNLTGRDISLLGLSLQYSINGTNWEVLPLEGIIKNGSTFLIRGAECSKEEANTTIIKVKTFDMEWKNKDGLIKFSNVKAKFLLTYGITACKSVNPYIQDTSATEKAYCNLGYIDMVGANKKGASAAEAIDGFEQTTYAELVPTGNRLYLKYFSMDQVTQATKLIGKRKNSVDWAWVTLDKNFQPHIENYTPKASFENKTIFFDKSNIDPEKPNLVTVTFGINANTTRCFNWISTGYYDEFLWYRKSGDTDWTKVESFKEGDGRVTFTNEFYNRIRVQATNKTCYTAHKLIITSLAAGTYEYKCGREGKESEIFRFKVAAYVSGGSFSFVQTSDQQGFNWCEYEVWRKAAEFIRKNHNPLFTMNTGDMTQNGNRLNEWIDYYEAGKSLFQGQDISGMPAFNGVEQMNVIGNNDLCPELFEKLGDGSDISKINSINFRFFYTYEIDEANPPILVQNGTKYFIPSVYSFNYNDVHFICVNSEIPSEAQLKLFEGADVYKFVKDWATADLDKYSSKRWKIASCHEMPFTIITADLIKSYIQNPETSRGGSRLNTDSKSGDIYWFSKLLEEKGVRLCIGGHKHTYSVSRPIKETMEDGKLLTMQPTVQVTDAAWYGSLSADDKKLCKAEVVSKFTAPVYAMCQATGYKHTSNKELPAETTPWLENYFPSSLDGTSRQPNPGQKFPFFIVWNIANTAITGSVYKLQNIMTAAGKFNINEPPTAEIVAVNGNGSSTSPITITY